VTYLVEQVDHHGRRTLRGTCETRAQAKRWQRIQRRVLPAVRRGECNVSVRKVGS
jgi:hypothetical protein